MVARQTQRSSPGPAAAHTRKPRAARKQPVLTESQPVFSALTKLADGITAYLLDARTWRNQDDAYLCAIWVIHTWFIDKLNTWFVSYNRPTVFLLVMSHERDAGKTSLLIALSRVCPGSRVTSPSAAALTVFVRDGNRTMFIDQMQDIDKAKAVDQRLFYSHHANGHTPGISYNVTKPDGTGEYRELFYPRAFAGLSTWKIPDDITSRSFKIWCEPGTDADQITRERRQAKRPLIPEALRLTALAETVIAKPELQSAFCETMFSIETRSLTDGTQLINRDADNWRSLISIADLCGDTYGKRMREIAAARTSGKTGEEAPRTEADRIDEAIINLWRNGTLPVDSYLEPGKPPLLRHLDGVLLLTNADFGWPNSRRKIGRTVLGSATIMIDENKAEAELKIRATDFKAFCAALDGPWSELEVKRAYRDAERLRAQQGRYDMQLAMYRGQAKRQRVVAIDFSRQLFGSSENRGQWEGWDIYRD